MRVWRDDESRKGIVLELVDLARAGRVDLAISQRVHADVWKEPDASRINELPELEIRKDAGFVFTIGYSTIGGPDFLGSQEFVDFRASDDFAAIERSLIDAGKLDPSGRRGPKPPDERDWDHLHAHLCQGRDVFLTWDGGIHAWAEVLRERLGIVLETPESYLDGLWAPPGSP